MVCLQKSLNFKQLQFIAAEECDYKICRHLKGKFKPKNETKKILPYGKKSV